MVFLAKSIIYDDEIYFLSEEKYNEIYNNLKTSSLSFIKVKFPNGLQPMFFSNKVGLRDLQGNSVINPIFNEILRDNILKLEDNLQIRINEKWGYLKTPIPCK